MPQAPSNAIPDRRWGRVLLWTYLALLAASHLARLFQPGHAPRSFQTSLSVPAIDDGHILADSVVIAYQDLHPPGVTDPPAVVLLHGSPMASTSMNALAPLLADSLRLLIPDLPGFGGSTLRIPDYSVEAHGLYLIEWLDALGVDKAHLVAYSQGGGVAIEAAGEVPDRVSSLTLLSAIGVQELELLGSYPLNHAVYAMQLGFLWLIQEGVPHFGWMDTALLNVAYARNFFDTDQRPLRGILEHYRPPMLILHGENDPFIPFAAAVEHHRIVPQSELVRFDGGHGLLFSRPDRLASPIRRFIRSVEQGTAPTRADASPARLAAAEAPFDPSVAPEASGLTLAVLVFLLIVSTLGSEDLTCIGAGLLVAQGTMSYTWATLACFIGLYVGDIGLYAIGRYLGRPMLRRRPFKWFFRESALNRGALWLKTRGPAVIVASRFIPGSRMPTYVSAGVFKMPFWRFSFYFLAAAAVWTPALVALSVLFGQQLLALFGTYQAYALPLLIGALLLFWLGLKLITPLFTHRGRRLLVSSWRRATRWEFWPMWLFYSPVVLYGLYLGLRYRSLTLFTAANPGLPEGGFVGESKSEILERLRGAHPHLARFDVIEPNATLDERLGIVSVFMQTHGLAFPVVLKPDVGERGSNVAVVRSEAAAWAYLESHPGRTLLQEYVPGLEFGVFYYRYPDEADGRLFSITDKQFPSVTGNGSHTLERLILDDGRAVCMAPLHLEVHQDRLFDVPAPGERVQLVELGTHCKGAVFLDGHRFITPALEAKIDEISKTVPGFYFGRYDIRTPSVDDFMAGRTFKIVELNGVTSEATHIYDPRKRLWDAYRVLMRQWRIAFEIGAQNRARGISPARLRTLLHRLVHRRADRMPG